MDEIKREYYKNGNIRIVRYFNNNGKLHRKNGPAVKNIAIKKNKGSDLIDQKEKIEDIKLSSFFCVKTVYIA